MASNHPVEQDSGATDSVNSTPRSGHLHKWNEEGHPLIRFMCSFGGRIVPRPHDNQLRYVGGDTRIVAVHGTTTFASLLSKLSKLSGSTDFTIKYQLPNEDLDALISVTTDEDLENMLEEYDRLAHSGGGNSKTARLRLFLFTQSCSRTSSITSLIDGGGGTKQWLLDALNGGSASLERGRSEVSSIISEVPDYLFGLDSETDIKTRNPNWPSENVSVFSDPGSPAPPVASSSYFSTSSAAGVPAGLPPVKTKPENPSVIDETKGNRMEPEAAVHTQTGYVNSPMYHYVPDPHLQGQGVQPMPVYYVPAGNVPVRSVQVQMPYMQRIPMPAPPAAHPYHNQMIANLMAAGQMYGQVPQVVRPGEIKPVPGETYELPVGVIGDGGQVFYRQKNPGAVPAYPPSGVPVTADLHVNGTDYAGKDR
ncbi:RAF-like serine/threonine-protein kinase PRAF [Aristolochia californica]|uniref:RAF-like serine/threonine-protein kinase PRAF n=1 Tax=Aristolochia californica TaxID=171875 RepID=UPI0035E39176